MAAEVVVARHRSDVVQAATSSPLPRRRRRPDQAGVVTAEAAAVVPVLLALVLGSVWFVALAATKVRVVDAAREVARVAARGESDSSAVRHGDRVAPSGTRFVVRRDGDRVVVDASVEVRGPGGLFAFLPGVTVESVAVAAEEPR